MTMLAGGMRLTDRPCHAWTMVDAGPVKLADFWSDIPASSTHAKPYDLSDGGSGE